MMIYQRSETEIPGNPTHLLREISVKLTLGLEPGESPMEHARCWIGALATMAAWAAAQREVLSNREKMQVATAEDSEALKIMGEIAASLAYCSLQLEKNGYLPDPEIVSEHIPQIQAAVAVEGALQDAGRLLKCAALKPKPDQKELGV